MKILFISSGNSKYGISPIILNQGNSLVELGHEVKYFAIKGKGLKGYGKNIYRLRKYLRYSDHDIIHAHYSLSGMVASISGAKPLIVSLMGSDVKAKGSFKSIIHFFSKYYWKTVIVKSQDMKNSLGLKNLHIIPNGVEFGKFIPLDRTEALKKTGWNPKKKQILFAANPERIEKNFMLAKEAFELMDGNEYDLNYLIDVPNPDIPYYLNSADVVLLTSFYEGSPNVVKEAMACNRPIVATNVGDIQEVIKNTYGCFITSFYPEEIKKRIEEAIEVPVTDGRSKISHLESSLIARKLQDLYRAIEQ